MTIELNTEKEGLGLRISIITNNVKTHSAMQEVPKEIIENIKGRIQAQLNQLLNEAIVWRKAT